MAGSKMASQMKEEEKDYQKKNKTFKTTALNCFAFSKTRTSEYRVQTIKKNFRLLVCVQICLFLTTRYNSGGANFARDANRHQK
jgi:hypothetical protein